MPDEPSSPPERGRTVHGEAANAGHRVLAPDDAEVEAYLEQALHAPPPQRAEEIPAEPDTVVILDFGSQFAQLIARRVRELSVYSELLPHDTPWAEIERRRPKAIILSGGPSSVYDAGAPHPDPAIWAGGIPILGICYGAQLVAQQLGGEVRRTGSGEYGRTELHVRDGGSGFPQGFADRAFERFARSDPGRSGEGAGLGLSIVRAIARAHGGSAGVADGTPAGADVWLAVPRGAY